MLYIYDTVEMARAIVMTARYIGLEAHQIGSAVVMTQKDYDIVVIGTSAPKAVIVATELEQ
jgi:hypothetical protein